MKNINIDENILGKRMSNKCIKMIMKKTKKMDTNIKLVIKFMKR